MLLSKKPSIYQRRQEIIILCNRVGKENVEFGGRRLIAGPDGHILAEAKGEEEEVIYATLYQDRIVEARVFLPTFVERRPEL